MPDPIHINCINCNYNLVGIDLAGLCPECGSRILEKCFWCDYDLTNTSPNDNCPECGVPAINSIGDGVLATTPDALLQSIYTGFKLASMLIPVSVIWLMASLFLLGSLAWNPDRSTFNLVLILVFLVSKLLILAILFGWSKIALPIPGLPESIAGTPQRKLLKLALITYATIFAISIPISFIPANPDPAAASELIGSIKITILLIGLLSFIVLYYAQLWYMQWFTKLIKNKMMHKRAKQMVWSGPLILVCGLILTLGIVIGPFIVLALYWNMLVHIRKDLKAIRQHTQALA